MNSIQNSTDNKERTDRDLIEKSHNILFILKSMVDKHEPFFSEDVKFVLKLLSERLSKNE